LFTNKLKKSTIYHKLIEFKIKMYIFSKKYLFIFISIIYK